MPDKLQSRKKIFSIFLMERRYYILKRFQNSRNKAETRAKENSNFRDRVGNVKLPDTRISTNQVFLQKQPPVVFYEKRCS